MTTNDPHSAERVRAWAAQQYPSGTPLDQDRRMVAAETEAYLSGRTGREASELALAAKHAGPIDPPAAQEPTDAEVEAACAGFYEDPSGLTSWTGLVKAEPRLAEVYREGIRRALSAARAARRDEEKR